MDYFLHSRTVHPVDVSSSVPTDLFELAVEYLTAIEGIQPPFCTICSLDCGTFEKFRVHAWRAHGDRISAILKQRMRGYRNDTFTDSFDLGVRVLNAIHVGQIWHGSLCCGFCRIGFDTPGELFVHLFHRHARVCATSAQQAAGWPIPGRDLVAEMQELVGRFCQDNTLDCLTEAGIFSEGKCMECQVALEDEAVAWQHALQSHIVLVF
jgi:hypothetical protein